MNNKLIILAVIVFFSISGGIIGQILFQAYLVDNAFNIPMLGDINIKNSTVDGGNLVISNPSKVVVEQNEKVIEATNSAKSGIVGIYKKISASTTDTLVANKNDFNIADYYRLNDNLGQGFVITSDGWIVSAFIPQELLEDKAKTASTTKKIFDSYVIITNDKKIFNIDNIIVDKKTTYAFWKIGARDLSVRVLVPRADIENGQVAMALNWQESVWLTTISAKSEKNKNLVLSSDGYFNKIILANNPSSAFFSSFLFDLSGNLIAFINKDGSVASVDNYISCINCLLANGSIKRPLLGVNYIDLSTLVAFKNNNYPENGALISADEKGVAVKKSSPADIAKLKSGDIILSVNNINLDKNKQLNSLINSYKPGEKIDIVYLRQGKRENISLVLGELN